METVTTSATAIAPQAGNPESTARLVRLRQILDDVGYTGWATVELDKGDAAYLKDVSARFDRFLAGQKPVA